MRYDRTILHVDDDPQITRIVSQHLTKSGYQVTSLNDPRKAMTELANSHQRLVLLDINMPHLSGLDVLQEIKNDGSGTQVIMLTALATMQTILQAYSSGAEYCIFKPITDMTPLMSAIERTFFKIDQWWTALDHLVQEKQSKEVSREHPSKLSELQTAITALNSDW